jgi:hypothetical protein
LTTAGFSEQVGGFCAPAGEPVSVQLKFIVPEYHAPLKPGDSNFEHFEQFCLLRLEPNLPRRVLRLAAPNCTTQHVVPAVEFGAEWRAGLSPDCSATPKQTRCTPASENRRPGDWGSSYFFTPTRSHRTVSRSATVLGRGQQFGFVPLLAGP